MTYEYDLFYPEQFASEATGRVFDKEIPCGSGTGDGEVLILTLSKDLPANARIFARRKKQGGIHATIFS